MIVLALGRPCRFWEAEVMVDNVTQEGHFAGIAAASQHPSVMHRGRTRDRAIRGAWWPLVVLVPEFLVLITL